MKYIIIQTTQWILGSIKTRKSFLGLLKSNQLTVKIKENLKRTTTLKVKTNKLKSLNQQQQKHKEGTIVRITDFL